MSAAVPQLAPPGAGLPWFESLMARWFGRRMLRSRFHWESAQSAIVRISSQLAKDARAMDDATFAGRVLIQRMRGLEDSSRYWSPEMVLEHLVIAGELFTDYVVALSNDRPITDRRGIADIKPRGGLGQAVIARFVAVHQGIPARLRAEAGPFRAGPTHAHAWFGNLTAEDWLSLTALHLALHMQQWKAIRGVS